MNTSDRARLDRIIEIGDKLMGLLRTEQIGSEQIRDDYRVQWLITTPLYNIGEQVYRLSKEFKEQHPEIPWSGVAGLRHRLVHDYEGTNWNLIAVIVSDELPEFLNQVKDIGN